MESFAHPVGSLADSALDSFESSPSVIYALDGDLRIVYCNPAWDRFAAENGGHGLSRQYQLGRTLMYAIPGLLRDFYRHVFQRVRESAKPWEQPFECSSPDRYRSFRMRIEPVAREGGFLITNTLLIERPHSPSLRVCEPSDFIYRSSKAQRPRSAAANSPGTRDPHLPGTAPFCASSSEGFVTMCCLCRRTRHAADRGRWDWVPDYLRNPPLLVSDEICPHCFETHHLHHPILQRGSRAAHGS